MAISIQNKQKLLSVDLGRIRRSMNRLLRNLSLVDREVSILLVDDNKIREINHNYLHRNRPTNVISFAITEGAFGDVSPALLGDIIISVETAARDAVDSGIDFRDEIDFLLIHGLLHLVGYDHEGVDKCKSEEMINEERELFFLLRRYQIE